MVKLLLHSLLIRGILSVNALLSRELLICFFVAVDHLIVHRLRTYPDDFFLLKQQP